MNQPQNTLPSSALAHAFSVSEINQMVADALSSTLAGVLSVEGEIANLTLATSGHRYFSLKDSRSTISCALFRGTANRLSRQVLSALKNGDKVVIKASLSVYQPRGSYQLLVNHIEPAGFGDLAKAFAALKQKLDSAGYTASARKRPIPTWSHGIAVVTSATGAALQDVLTTLARRAPFIPVRIYPTLVQGREAPEQLIHALQRANSDPHAAVIVLVRGGGSLEDLQAFNSESVAMAVVNSRLPVVSGVGHETDFTIVDFVSDARAPTPTAAAELVSPDQHALRANLHKHHQRLQTAIRAQLQQRRQHSKQRHNRLNAQHPQRQLAQCSQRLDELGMRLQTLLKQRVRQQRAHLQQHYQRLLASSPRQRQQQMRVQLDNIQQRLQQHLSQQLASARQQLASQQARLQHSQSYFTRHRQQLKGLQARLILLSPLGVLERGYALAFDARGKVLRRASAVSSGERIRLRLAEGEIQARVE